MGSRAWLAAVLSLAMAGCLGDLDSADDLYSAKIEGRLVGEDSEQPWGPSPLVGRVEWPKLSVTKPDPGPLGGGGQRFDLASGTLNLTFEARLANEARRADFVATWQVRSATLQGRATGSPLTSAEQAGDLSFSFQVPEPGAYEVRASIQKADPGVFDDVHEVRFELYVDAHALVESSVFPQRAMQAPYPSNYEAMADEFAFRTNSTLRTFLVRSEFRGNWTPPQGTDVDLELQDGDGDMMACVGTAGTNSPYPDPEQAKEKLEAFGLAAGEFVLRVGALSRQCTDPYYHNAGPVPYALNVWWLFSGSEA